jgi:hypothetical protein
MLVQADGPRHFCGVITGFYSGINQTIAVVKVKKGYAKIKQCKTLFPVSNCMASYRINQMLRL